MNVAAVGGITLFSLNVNPEITNPTESAVIEQNRENQLRRYTGEAGIRARARLLAHNLGSWFEDVVGGELHEGNVIMEESLDGVRWQIVAGYYLQRKFGAADSRGIQDQKNRLRQYSLITKGTCITTDDYLNSEKVKLGFSETDLWGVEAASVTSMRRRGFSYSNGIRVVFGRHYIIYNRSPRNVESRKRLQRLAAQVAHFRQVLERNARAIERLDWEIVLKNRDEMNAFITSLRKDSHFNFPDEFRSEWLGRIGKRIESAVRNGAFRLFAALIAACGAIIKVCYMTRSTFLAIQQIVDERPSVAIFREKIACVTFGKEYEIDEVLAKAKDDFRAVVETAQGLVDLEHAYLMYMNDSVSSIFKKPVRKYKAGDLYKLTMEKLSKTNIRCNDDERVAFGRDVVSVKVMGKRVIRTHEEQMLEAAEMFGYIKYLGSTYSKASVMLAVLNIIKASGCGGAIFDKFVFHKVWDDICTATSFESSEFTQVILDYFPKKVSVCNAIARMNPTCLYPSATYLAMVTKARIQVPTVRRDTACWLWQTTDIRTSNDAEAGDIVADEALFVPHMVLFRHGRIEAAEIAGSWYQVERADRSPLLHIAGKLKEAVKGEDVTAIDIHEALLAGNAHEIGAG